MSARINASGEYLRRSASMPDDELVTMCGWSCLKADRNNYSCVCSLDNASDRYILLETDSDGTTLSYAFSGTSDAFGALGTVTVGVPFFWALTSSGVTAGATVAYFRNAGSAALTSHAQTGTNRHGTWTPTGMYFGSNGFDEYIDGWVGGIKVWDAALTAAEVLAESFSITPVRWTNLHAFWPMLKHDDLADYWTSGKSLTAGGTLTTEEGPPIQWKRGRSRYVTSGAAAPPSVNRRRRVLICGAAA